MPSNLSQMCSSVCDLAMQITEFASLVWYDFEDILQESLSGIHNKRHIDYCYASVYPQDGTVMVVKESTSAHFKH